MIVFFSAVRAKPVTVFERLNSRSGGIFVKAVFFKVLLISQSNGGTLKVSVAYTLKITYAGCRYTVSRNGIADRCRNNRVSVKLSAAVIAEICLRRVFVLTVLAFHISFPFKRGMMKIFNSRLFCKQQGSFKL